MTELQWLSGGKPHWTLEEEIKILGIIPEYRELSEGKTRTEKEEIIRDIVRNKLLNKSIFNHPNGFSRSEEGLYGHLIELENCLAGVGNINDYSGVTGNWHGKYPRKNKNMMDNELLPNYGKKL